MRDGVAWYLGLVAVLGAAFYALILATGRLGAAGGLYVQGMMWTPALAAALTIAARKLDWRSLGLSWGGGRYALIGYLIPLGYAAASYGLVWLSGFGGFPNTQNIAAISGKLGWHFATPAAFIAAYALMTGTIGMIAATANALGEEIGWRGFLTPRLVTRFGFVPGSMVVGAIWGAWHLPLVVFADYNTGTPMWFSIPCFMVMVCAMSIVASYLRLRSDSVWPCAILHASHNLYIQNVFSPLTAPHGAVTAYLTDEFGIVIPLLTVVLAIVVWRRIADTPLAAREAV